MADSPLQKAPSGLTGFFDLKTLGAQPTLFADRVMPVVEVSEFYAVPANRTIQTGTASLNARGSSVSLTVPSGVLWRVHAIGWNGAFNAGDYWYPCPLINIGNVTVRLPVPFTTAAQIPAGQDTEESNGIIFDAPLLLQSGSLITLISGTNIGNATSVTLSALIDSIPI